MVSRKKPIKEGFTLIELLVVIAIIAILAAILFPVFARAKEAGRTAKCASNLKQINTSLLMYVDDNGQRFPIAAAHNLATHRAQTGNFGWPPSGTYAPMMQDLLARYIRSNNVWLCPAINVNDKIPNVLYPDGSVYTDYKNMAWSKNVGTTQAGRNAVTNYAWLWKRITNVGTGAVADISGSSVSEVKRASKAVMFFETPSWGIPPHKAEPVGAINIVYFDGHVKYLNKTWGDLETWSYWATEGWDCVK